MSPEDTSWIDDDCLGRTSLGEQLDDDVLQESVSPPAAVLAPKGCVGEVLARKAGELLISSCGQRTGVLLDSFPFGIQIDDVSLPELVKEPCERRKAQFTFIVRHVLFSCTLS